MAGGGIVSARLSLLADSYLMLRRSSGYHLYEAEYHIRAFISWLDDNRAGQDGFSTQDALRWACLPGGRASWHAKRLGSIRGWAAYAHARDASVGLVPAASLPAHVARPAPYIYREGEAAAVMEVFAQRAAHGRNWPWRWAYRTYQVLTGVLACTGIRVGEAIRLNVDDVGTRTATVKIVSGKTGRERLVLLHPTAMQALGAYLDDSARPRTVAAEPAFISSTAARVDYKAYQRSFHAAVREVGLQPQGLATPTIHSLRHSFAVSQLAAAYQDGADPNRRLTLLSTWLGHVSPKNTYWYLSATEELLGAAADLVERQVKP